MDKEYRIPTIEEFVPGFKYELDMDTIAKFLGDFSYKGSKIQV